MVKLIKHNLDRTAKLNLEPIVINSNNSTPITTPTHTPLRNVQQLNTPVISSTTPSQSQLEYMGYNAPTSQPVNFPQNIPSYQPPHNPVPMMANHWNSPQPIFQQQLYHQQPTFQQQHVQQNWNNAPQLHNMQPHNINQLPQNMNQMPPNSANTYQAQYPGQNWTNVNQHQPVCSQPTQGCTNQIPTCTHQVYNNTPMYNASQTYTHDATTVHTTPVTSTQQTCNQLQYVPSTSQISQQHSIGQTQAQISKPPVQTVKPTVTKAMDRVVTTNNMVSQKKL